MSFFYKIVNNLTPQYLKDYLNFQNVGNLRRRPSIRPIYARTERFSNSFFPYCVTQWNNLDSQLKNMPSISTFKKALSNIFKPNAASIFGINNVKGLTFLTRLRVGFSHLREHKFRHGFRDTLDPFCSCRTNSIEDTEHYLLHCSNFINSRLILYNNLQAIDINLTPYSFQTFCNMLLYGNSELSDNINFLILNSTIKFLLDTDRFSGPLF